MRGVRHTILAAQRLLLVARLIEHCGTGLAWGAAAGLAAVAADRLIGFGMEWWWLAAVPVATGAAFGVARAVLSRPSELIAAGMVDDALSLQDRLTTGLTLTTGQDAAFTQIALREADTAAAHANTNRAVHLRFGSAWYTWSTLAGVAVCVGLFAPQFDLLGRERAAKQLAIEDSRRADVAANVAEAVEAIAPTTTAIDEPKSEARSEQMAELNKLRAELEAGTLSADEATAKAVSELQNIAEKSERAADLAAAKNRAMSQSLSGLGKNDGAARASGRASAPGPDAKAPAGQGAEGSADESPLTRAVRNGDLGAAREAARELMKRSTLTPEDRQSLAKDLDRLSDDLMQLEAQEAERAKAEAAERATSEAAERAARGEDPAAASAEAERNGGTTGNAGAKNEAEGSLGVKPESTKPNAAKLDSSQTPATNDVEQTAPKTAGAGSDKERPPLPTKQPQSAKPEESKGPEKAGKPDSGDTADRTSKPKDDGSSQSSGKRPDASPRQEQGAKPTGAKSAENPQGGGDKAAKPADGENAKGNPTGKPEAAKEGMPAEGANQDSKPRAGEKSAPSSKTGGKPDETARGERQAGKPGSEQSPSEKPNPSGEATGEASKPDASATPRPGESVKPQAGEQTPKAGEPSGAEQGQSREQLGRSGKTGGERREVSEQQLREQFEKSGMTPEEAQRAVEQVASKSREEQARREASQERRELAEKLKDAAKSLSGEENREKRQEQAGEKQSGAKGGDTPKPSDSGKTEGSKPEAEHANPTGTDHSQGRGAQQSPKPAGEKPSGEGAAKPDPDAKSPGAETVPKQAEPGTVKPEGTPRPSGTPEGSASTTPPTPQPQGTPPSQGQKPAGVQPKPSEQGTTGTTPHEQPVQGETQPGGPKMEAPAAGGSKPRAGQNPSPSEIPDGTEPDKTGARPEPGAKPAAGGEKSAAESQDGSQGREPNLPNDIPAPTKESLDQLAKQLERMAAEGAKQKTDRATAERAREQAQKLAEKLSPQQQERLRQWAEGMARQHPELADRLANQNEQDRPREDRLLDERMSGDDDGADRDSQDGMRGNTRDVSGHASRGGPDGLPGGNRPARAGQAYAPKRTELVDARDAGGKRAGEQRDQVVAEWLAPPTPGSASGPGPSAGERMRQAAKSAQQAVDDRAIPSRYDRLVQRYFRRLPEKVAERAATTASPASVPAKDAP